VPVGRAAALASIGASRPAAKAATLNIAVGRVGVVLGWIAVGIGRSCAFG